MNATTRRLHYAWIRFRRNLRRTVVSKIGDRIDAYHKVP